MSYNSLTRFARPLRVELRASRRLALAAAALHSLACGACLLATLPLPLRLLLAGLTAVHYGVFLRRHASARAGRAIRSVAWDRTRGWQVRCRRGAWQPASLRLPVFVSASLVVMRFRPATGSACSALVVADRLPADDFRRLRVRLLQAARAGATE